MLFWRDPTLVLIKTVHVQARVDMLKSITVRGYNRVHYYYNQTSAGAQTSVFATK
jgi:hypothetical protein